MTNYVVASIFKGELFPHVWGVFPTWGEAYRCMMKNADRIETRFAQDDLRKPSGLVSARIFIDENGDEESWTITGILDA